MTGTATNLASNDKASARTKAIVTAPIASALFRLTAPMVGGIVALMALGLADAYFIAQLGLSELAALGFVLPITQGVNSVGLGLGMALSVLVSRLFGQQNIPAAARLITDGRLLMLIAGIVLQLILYALQPLIFASMGADSIVQVHISEFMVLWLPVVPILLLTLTGNSTLRAIGSPAKSAVILTLLAVLNGLLDPLLIFGYGAFSGIGMGGAALATSIAWLITFVISDYILGVQEKLILKGRLHLQTLLANWREMTQIGIPAIFANFLTPFSAAILTALVAKYGAEAVAGFTVATRIEALCLLVIFALSSTLPMFIGQNIGAGRIDRVHKALFGVLWFSVIFQTLVWLLVLVSASNIVTAFSDNAQVSLVAIHYLWIVPLSYGGQAVGIMVMVSLNVLKRPKTALLVAGLRLLVINLPLAYMGGVLGGTTGLFCGYAVGNLVSGMITWKIMKTVWLGEARSA